MKLSDICEQGEIPNVYTNVNVNKLNKKPKKLKKGVYGIPLMTTGFSSGIDSDGDSGSDGGGGDGGSG